MQNPLRGKRKDEIESFLSGTLKHWHVRHMRYKKYWILIRSDPKDLEIFNILS